MNRFIYATICLCVAMVVQTEIVSSQEIAVSNQSLPVPGETFRFDGHEAFVIAPPGATDDTPWVWYAPTLPNLPSDAETWMFERFTKAGIAIAGIDVGESYGNEAGRKIYSAFYHYLVNSRRFSKRPVLLARSRGGLMLYSWAADNADCVGGVAGIYPVCNLASYPGIEKASSAYGMTAEQLDSQLSQHNPIDRLASLAEAKVPIFHIHGDDDKIVPLEANSALLANRYSQLGGPVELEIVRGQGHNMWSGWFQSESLTRFVITHAKSGDSDRNETSHPVPSSDLWLTYTGIDGPGKGKHIILIAADQEYRSEQSMPMLAKVLAKRHGFDCTVLFSVNEKGEVDPTLPAPFEDKSKRHRIPGLQYLEKADCVIWLSRFMQLPDDQMQHFHDYFDSGKPLIALRTANHGFWGGKAYEKNGERVALRELLGGTFMGHHGGWHRESTRGVLVPENRRHPILIGVEDIWGTSDVYRCHDDKFPFPADCTALVMGQPLINLQPDAPPNPEKEPLPIAWTKTWIGNAGLASNIFHFTMGSAEDFQNEGVRRLTINAVYWGLGMIEAIDPDRSVEPVDQYQPLQAGFNYEKLGVQPRKPAYYDSSSAASEVR